MCVRRLRVCDSVSGNGEGKLVGENSTGASHGKEGKGGEEETGKETSADAGEEIEVADRQPWAELRAQGINM